jgi:hypothetical protein
MRHSFRFLVIFSLAALALATNFSVNQPGAAAQSAPALVASTTVPMNLDCSATPNTQKEHELLSRYGLCGYGSGVSRDSQVCGNCGCLSINLYSDGSDYALSVVTISTTIGPILQANYSASWYNYTIYSSGGYGDSTGPTGSAWTSSKKLGTGPGSVVAVVNTATDWTFLGPCTNNGQPSSGTQVGY